MHRQSNKDFNNNDDFIDLFEEKLCAYTGASYAVVVDRCTNAILLSLEYYKDKTQTITIPNRTYLSVPMTLINYGYNVQFRDEEWTGNYQIGKTNIYDYAVGFEKDMYVPGTVQCLSFQQKKRLAIGKGGAILLDNKEMYLKLRRMRHDGRETHLTTSAEMHQSLDSIIMGYHMNMSPDEAAKGVLLMNQLTDSYTNGSSLDYPDISVLKCFNL